MLKNLEKKENTGKELREIRKVIHKEGIINKEIDVKISKPDRNSEVEKCQLKNSLAQQQTLIGRKRSVKFIVGHLKSLSL